jgi:CheY-like chemotaxis protein
MRILLIEDEYLSVKALSFQLTGLGYEVASAGSGQEALELINKESFDLLICDLILPDISGVTVSQLTLSFHEKKIPTIFISKLENGKRILEQHGIFYHAFLLKPITTEILFEEIRKLESAK